MSFIKTLAGLGLALAIATPALAQDLNPVGTWQTASGESRYSVSYCGDGTDLCAKLIWLRSDAKTPENVALLNQLVVSNAKSTAANKWRGTVHYDGQTVNGSVTLVNAEKMRLSGCKLVACRSVDFVKL